jgi:hypothetical protein
VADTEHVVDDLEALVLGRVVDCGDIGDLGVFGRGVVLEEGEGGDDARRGNVDGQLILPYRESAVLSDIFDSWLWSNVLLDVFGQTRHEVLSVFVQRLALLLVGVCRVHDGPLELDGLVAGSKLRRMSEPPSPSRLGRERTRMFGVSWAGPATSFARSAVAAKVRTALPQVDARTAAPNGRPTASRIAIVCV